MNHILHHDISSLISAPVPMISEIAPKKWSKQFLKFRLQGVDLVRKSNQILFLYLCYRNEVYWHLSGFAGCGSLHGNSIAYLQFCGKEEIGVGPLKPVGRFWVLCSSPNGCFIPTDLLVSPMSAKIRAEHRCPARVGRETISGIAFLRLLQWSADYDWE